MKRIFLSDLHIGDRDSKFFGAFNTVKDENPDVLYLLGDVFDLPTRGKAARTAHQVGLHLLHDLSRSMKVKYVFGDRDLEMSGSDSFFEKVSFTAPGDMVLKDGKRVRFMHGHEYDRHVMSWLPAARVLSQFNSLLLQAYGAGFDGLKFRLHRYEERKSFAAMLGKMRRVALEDNRNVDVLVMGHTHRPEDRSEGGLRYLNTGDWLRSFTYVTEEDGTLFLKHA